MSLSRPERRLALLEELADIGMSLARDLGARAAAAPSEDPQRDVAPAFAQISRAVRLTLAMEATLEAQILALRNGEAPSLSAPAPAGPWKPPTPNYLPPPAPGEPDTRRHGETSTDSACGQRNRIRDAVWTAIDGAYESCTDGFYALDRVHERLIEGEVYDRVLFRPWREAVAAICTDLGLEPDWSTWSDETGFPREPIVRHSNNWSYWHKQAAYHRREYIDRHGSEPEPRPPPTPPPDHPSPQSDVTAASAPGSSPGLVDPN